MTEKEMATELVDKFYQTTPNEAWYNPPLASASIEYKAWEQAKQCALIAVNMIISSNPHSNPFNTEVHSTMQYWGQVKTEIEKL